MEKPEAYETAEFKENLELIDLMIKHMPPDLYADTLEELDELRKLEAPHYGHVGDLLEIIEILFERLNPPEEPSTMLWVK